MAELKAVKDPGPDKKAGKERPKSGVAFPYYGLNESIQVAHVMHHGNGGAADRAQLAALLNYKSTNSGTFLTRVAAARLFGLIEPGDGNRLRVTMRGRYIVAPISPAQQAAAKAEAFLAVDLFRRVFDMFNGSELPEEAGLKNLFENDFGVVKTRIVPTIRIMRESADEAGFFKLGGPRRMVMPTAGAGSAIVSPATKPDAPSDEPSPRYSGGGGGGGGGGGDLDGIDPAIVGLLKRLPPGGTTLTAARRQTLIDAFTATIKFLYPEPELGGE
jgi:hypothetical protein